MKTDEQIVEAVKSGRREGQDLMVCRYGQPVFALIVRLVTDTMDAEELTQDTFLKAFSNIDKYDPHRASLSTWICLIATAGLSLLMSFGLISIVSNVQDILQMRTRLEAS